MNKTIQNKTTTQKPSEIRLDVPVIFTIDEEDIKQAEHYTSCSNCLISTALRRRGYPVIRTSMRFVRFDDGKGNEIKMFSDDISAYTIGLGSEKLPYKNGLTIILYPEKS